MLSSEHYLRSPLVQGGLEIECQFVIETRATMLKSQINHTLFRSSQGSLHGPNKRQSGWKSI